jgi:hypothetical protein
MLKHKFAVGIKSETISSFSCSCHISQKFYSFSLNMAKPTSAVPIGTRSSAKRAQAPTTANSDGDVEMLEPVKPTKKRKALPAGKGKAPPAPKSTSGLKSKPGSKVAAAPKMTAPAARKSSGSGKATSSGGVSSEDLRQFEELKRRIEVGHKAQKDAEASGSFSVFLFEQLIDIIFLF